MTLFKPRVGKVIFSQTTGGLSVIIPNKYDWFKILVYNKNLDFETEMSRDKGEKQRHWRLYYYHTRTLGRFIIIIIIIIMIFVKNIRPIN